MFLATDWQRILMLMFRMIGYGENLSSGFPLILNAWNEKHWMKPELLEQPELMQVKLTLHIQNEPVNERQQTILSIMEQNPFIIREDLANKLGISLATLKRELTSLRKEGYITRSGSDKNGQWIVVSK